jgi:hypothetical protein
MDIQIHPGSGTIYPLWLSIHSIVLHMLLDSLRFNSEKFFSGFLVRLFNGRK